MSSSSDKFQRIRSAVKWTGERLGSASLWSAVVLLLLVLGCLVAAVVTGSEWRDALTLREAEGKGPRIDHFVRWGLWRAMVANALIGTGLLLTLRWWRRKDESDSRLSAPVETGGRPAAGGLHWWLMIGLIMLLAVGIRWPRMELSLYNDEVAGFLRYIEGSFKDGIHQLDDETPVAFVEASWMDTVWGNREANNHGLFSVLARLCYDAWQGITGGVEGQVQEVPLRIPALLGGLLSVFGVARLGRSYGFAAAGLTAALLIAVHPWHLRYSTEARGYGLLLGLGTLAAWCLIEALKESDRGGGAGGRWRWWLGYAVCQAGYLWANLGAVYLAAGMNSLVLLAVTLRSYRAGRLQGLFNSPVIHRLLVANAITAMILMPLLMPCVPQITAAIERNPVFRAGVPFGFWPDVLCNLSIGMPYYDGAPENPWNPAVLKHSANPATWIGIVLVGATFAVGVFDLIRRSGMTSMVILGALLGPLLAWLNSVVTGATLLPWYVVFVLPYVVFCTGWGISRVALWLSSRRQGSELGQSRRQRYLGYALVAVVVWASYPALSSFQQRGKQALRNIITDIRGGVYPFAGEEQIHPIVIGWWTEASVYDPRMRSVWKVEYLQSFISQARREQRPLYYVLGKREAAKAEDAAVVAIVDDPEVFELVKTYPGLEQRAYTEQLFRLRPQAVDPESERDSGGESAPDHDDDAGPPSTATPVGQLSTIDYNREIRPILSKACFRCHGADENQRKAKLRLDQRDHAIAEDALVAGDSDGSEMMHRILSDDPDDVMPPPDKGEPLSAAEVDLLRRWIDDGAPYADHWAFEAPRREPLPAPESGWSPIDQWVRASLVEAGLQPAPEASRESWLRRVTFDLTGLPPTLEEIDAFLADTSETAYESVVDRLLASPTYGEQMAIGWLDVARYADTYGRHEDAECTTWPYRDWVIRAYNDNLPYDQFITWQTAGDLLPNPTRDQLIATCFNRLAQQSNEAGSNAEEFRLEQVADRVHTNATAFLGMTMECARCHDHKYDPLSQRDYYEMSAFFDNIDELGLFAVFTGGVPTPSILLYDEEQEQRVEQIEAEIAALESQRDAMREAATARFETWLETAWPPIQRPEPGFFGKVAGWFTRDPPPTEPPTAPEVALDFEGFDDNKRFANSANPDLPGELRRKTPIVEGVVGQAIQWKGDNYIALPAFPEVRRTEAFSIALWVKPLERFDRAVLVHRSRSGIDSASRGFEMLIEDGRASFGIVHFSPGNEIRVRSVEELPVDEWTHVAATYDGSSSASGVRLYINGEVLKSPEIVRDHLYRDIVYREEWGDPDAKDSTALALSLAGRHNDAGFSNGKMDEFHFYRCQLTAPEVRQLAQLPDDSEPEEWLEWYLREIDEPWREVSGAITALREETNELSGNAPELMVMQKKPGPPRRKFVLERGEFDQPTDEVMPSMPASILKYPDTLPQNRLGLAQWLTSPDNPLTARVEVNRLWQHFFGQGLVGTSEDFGTQGAFPSHPELLDWLAIRFRDDLGWDRKALCREIVLSTTYRQDSTPADPGTLVSDPENRLLARGPRSRLKAENIRDMALAVSGLLVRTIGGPSVKPYQPAGLWEQTGTQHVYHQDHGEDLYRRSLYTFWRRTLPPPTMTIFDAPTREYCSARRIDTATPLQSLVLMNDPQFVEAARVLAETLVTRFPDDDGQRVETAYRLLTSQRPTTEQAELLTGYLDEERRQFEAAPEKAAALIGDNGEFPRDDSLPAGEVAATTAVLRLLFGFSETITKP